ncbi:hypothetical protein HYDPIDRAFT_96261, partial [Hydnomerulius pinastri MD-312]
AIVCVAATTLAGAVVYVATKESQRQEGPDSVFRTAEQVPTHMQGGESDAKYSGTDVLKMMHERSGK